MAKDGSGAGRIWSDESEGGVRSKGLCKSCWTLQSLASERLFITTPNVVKNKMELWTPTDLRLSQCVLLQREVKNL